MSHAMYRIFLPSGRNWFRYSTHSPYSASSFDSRGTASFVLTRFRMKIGAP